MKNLANGLGVFIESDAEVEMCELTEGVHEVREVILNLKITISARQEVTAIAIARIHELATSSTSSPIRSRRRIPGECVSVFTSVSVFAVTAML